MFWAAASPLLALYFRDAYILSAQGAAMAVLYCGISFAFSLIAFLAFRISDGISRYFSVHDAFNVLKAVVASALKTVVLFTFTRLEGIPRSTPVLQVLIPCRRAFDRADRYDAVGSKRSGDGGAKHSEAEHIIIIGHQCSLRFTSNSFAPTRPFKGGSLPSSTTSNI